MRKTTAKKTPTARATHLRLFVNERPAVVERAAYVTAKLRQLREFGYETLTREHVDQQVDAVLAKKTLNTGLTVIGMFMQGEVLGGLTDAEAKSQR